MRLNLKNARFSWVLSKKSTQALKVYFAKLTGGGEATLKLENPEEPFNGGIDMIVQFPNKPSIVVSGASGGERSVSAVSFIFSLKEFTPASFYILDEVDAHLDAFHTTKLAEVLLEEAGKIQFIVISLRPEMVNKAQKVYGVYERNGSFKRGNCKVPAGGTKVNGVSTDNSYEKTVLSSPAMEHPL